MTQARTSEKSVLLVLLAALLACSGSSSLSYARIGVDVFDSSGNAVSTGATSACLLLPVLRGSRVDEKYQVSSSLVIRVSANRDGALVSFDNAFPAESPRSVTRTQLVNGYFEEIKTADASGTQFDVQLTSDCTTSKY
jgi:hypothetical protein